MIAIKNKFHISTNFNKFFKNFNILKKNYKKYIYKY